MTEHSTENSTEKAEETKGQGNATETETGKTENMIPKTRFDQVVNQKNELSETLKSLVDELKTDIPEEYQDLIPDTKPQDQIKWIRNAQKKGIFSKPAESSPDSKTPRTPKDTDFSKMKPTEKMKLGYKR